MKRVLIVGILLAGALVLGCKSAPSEKQIESKLQNVYDRYKGKLILDGATTYAVKKGDRLSAIADSLYRDGYYYPVIMLASNDVVVDPDKIQPGMKLTVPDLQRNLDNAAARANIKSFLGEIAGVEDSRNRDKTAKKMREIANGL